MIEVPFELARIDIESNGGVCIERRPIARSAAGPHPRLGLRGAPVREIKSGIVTAGGPGFGTDAEHVRKAAPGVASGLAGLRDGVELPEKLASSGVIGADEAFFVLIIGA